MNERCQEQGNGNVFWRPRILHLTFIFHPSFLPAYFLPALERVLEGLAVGVFEAAAHR